MHYPLLPAPPKTSVPIHLRQLLMLCAALHLQIGSHPALLAQVSTRQHAGGGFYIIKVPACCT